MDEAKDKRESTSRVGLIVLGLAAVAAVAGLGYRALSDGDESESVAAVDPDAPLSLEELEAQAKANPLDSKAQQALALRYMELERYEDAARVWRHARRVWSRGCKWRRWPSDWWSPPCA